MTHEPRRKAWRFPRFISEHAFDKLRSIDCTFAEFEAAIDDAEVIETVPLAAGQSKELLLVAGWTRPLHVVVVVDETRGEERLLTIYEPDKDSWTPDLRRRRR